MKKLSLLLIFAIVFIALSCGGDDSPGVIADTESPTTPLNLIVSNVTGTSALLSWDAATDNVAVTSYQIYQGTTLVETNLTTTNFSLSGLTEGENYSYYVTAIDAVGNESSASNTTVFSTLPEMEKPSTPMNFLASDITANSVLLSWDVSTDNVGVIAYRLYQNGILLHVNITNTSYTDESLNSNTIYEYQVTAIDAAGNESDRSNLVSFSTSISFEENLSDMGVFSGNLANLNPAADVQLFELNSALFTDYAAKQRLIRLPDGQKMLYDNSGLFPIFPDNTLMAKTFYYILDETNPNSEKQIIETRISIKVDGVWSMGTYIWNQAQTEATYDENGSSLPISYTDSSGTMQNVDYVIPTQANCITCHSNSNVIIPIGPKLRNWNFIPSYTNQNQLDYFTSIGILEGVNTTNISVLPDWTDVNLDILSRGRAYIDINCAHCHQPGGEVTNFGLDFRLEIAFDDTGIYANRGEIEVRVQSTVPTYRMPQIGRSVVHEEAVIMLLEYLDALD